MLSVEDLRWSKSLKIPKNDGSQERRNLSQKELLHLFLDKQGPINGPLLSIALTLLGDEQDYTQ